MYTRPIPISIKKSLRSIKAFMNTSLSKVLTVYSFLFLM